MAKQIDPPLAAQKHMSLKSSFLLWWTKRFGRQNHLHRGIGENRSALEKSIEKLGLELPDIESPLEKDEREMIHGVFELGETEVREIMVPRVQIVGIEVGSPLPDVIETIKRSGYSRFPLYEDSLDDIKGIIYAKDLLSVAVESKPMDLAQIVRKAFFIPETKVVDELLRELKKKRLHIAIVVDEYGGTSGLVTMEDIIEEIVGEIEDEFDGEAPILRISSGTYIVSGSVTVADLNDEIGLNFPEEEFETIGGLIYDLVGSLPEKGRAVEYHGVKFIVDQVQGQRILKVRLLIPDRSSDKKNG